MVAAPAPAAVTLKPYLAARPFASRDCPPSEVVGAEMFSAAAKACWYVRAVPARKACATAVLLLPPRLPNRFGKFAASQLARAVEPDPLLRLVMTFWPLPCQKLTPAVWPRRSDVVGDRTERLAPPLRLRS